MLDIIPTRTIRIPVDRAKVLASGTVKPEDSEKIVPYIDIKLKGSSILKSQLIVLDILAHNNWDSARSILLPVTIMMLWGWRSTFSLKDWPTGSFLSNHRTRTGLITAESIRISSMKT